MDLINVLQQFVALLVGGVQAMGTGIAGGISNMATTLFIDSSGTTPALSAFGGIMGIFCGVALAVGLTTRVFLWISSLGKN